MKPIRTLIVVDDDEIEHFFCRRVIEQSGLVENTLCFDMPDSALEFLRTTDRSTIDVILTDIRMPRMNGFEFLEAAVEEFGEDFVRIAIVMLTTSVDTRDRERAESLGIIKDYFQKPLEIAHLEKICQMLRA